MEKEKLSLMEAVDHLASMSEIGPTTTMQEGEESVNWASPKQALAHASLIQEVFRTLYHYLVELVEKEKERLKNPETARGVQALVLIAQEAVQKMDKYSVFGQSGRPLAKLSEYKQLQKFYEGTIAPLLELPSLPKEEGTVEGTVPLLEIEKEGIKNLEAVRRDEEYELFFIQREDGKPYFNRDLLRHLKLVGNFDHLVESTQIEDPLLYAKVLQDKEVYLGACAILESARPLIDEFYRERPHAKESPYLGALSKTLMALMMAAHSDNLLENSGAKGCISYYSDFHKYLRQTLATNEHQELETKEPFDRLLLTLTHQLCTLFFMRKGNGEEAISFIHKLIERGLILHPEKAEENLSTATPFWADFLKNDAAIRALFKQYPSGPLLKTLDALHENVAEEGFDPLGQENFPYELYSLLVDDLHVTVLRLPSPTAQKQIQKSEIAPEFLGMLREFKEKKARHLLINLQDRTSWEDHSRSERLEELSKEAEFASALTVVTFPKQTDFYFQQHEYESLNGAPVFIEQLLLQIAGGKQCGYFFPESLPPKELVKFSKESAHLIHDHFFDGKESLTRAERIDFIELFFHFLVLKLIEWTRCDSLSFTCKDALDTGAAASASFYAICHLLSSGRQFKEKERDALLFLFYYPALVLRERAIDPKRLRRAVSVLDLFEQKHKGLKGVVSIRFPKEK